MNFGEIAQAIQNTALFTSMRESQLVYPIVLSSHLATLGIFGALILATDLRLLGWAFKGVTITDMIESTRIWKRVGFVMMISFGILLGGAKLYNYYDNPYFQIKMSLLALMFIHQAIFRRSVYRNTKALDALPAPPRVAKIAAITSMMIWVGILSMGRWIAYYERPGDFRAQATLFLARR